MLSYSLNKKQHLSILRNYFLNHKTQIEDIYQQSIMSNLMTSRHFLAHLLDKNYKKIREHQIQILENTAGYYGLIDDDYYEFDELLFFHASDELIQQFKVVKKHIISKDLDFFNHTFKSYKYNYMVYGYLIYSQEFEAFTFKLREFNPFEFIGQKKVLIDFKNNENTRRQAMKNLVRTLGKSGIRFLDLSEWLGMPDSPPSPLIFNTSKGFKYPNIEFTHLWLRNYDEQKKFVTSYLSSKDYCCL